MSKVESSKGGIWNDPKSCKKFAESVPDFESSNELIYASAIF